MGSNHAKRMIKVQYLLVYIFCSLQLYSSLVFETASIFFVLKVQQTLCGSTRNNPTYLQMKRSQRKLNCTFSATAKNFVEPSIQNTIDVAVGLYYSY